ncbi:unnamed protein product [Urochloa humidicola]
MRRYIDYSNELDCLLPCHVIWQPYVRDEIVDMELSPLCTRDEALWRAQVPLICYFLVEYHLPCRVARQFGFLQHCPVEHNSTSQKLHKTDRRSQRGAKNWEEYHSAHILNWNNQANFVLQGGALHRGRPYDDVYLQWMKQNSRLKLRVAMTAGHIEDLPSDPEDALDPYDESTRPGTQPERAHLEDYIGQQLARFSNEAGHALVVPFGSLRAETTLRGFLERVRQGYRRMARKLNCMASPDEAFAVGAGGSGVHSGGSARQRSIARSSSARTTSTRGGRGGSLSIGSPRSSSRARAASGSSSRGKEPTVDDSDDEFPQDNASTNSEENDPTYGQDIIGSSQLPDAPSPTQATQGTPQKRRARCRDHTDVCSANVLPTQPGRPRRKKKPFTPHPTPREANV